MEEIKIVKNVYEEPKLEVIKFNVKEAIMFAGGGFPGQNASEVTGTEFPSFENDTY